MRTGRLFVISAPSGAGKTTLLKEVMARIPGIVFSVSHTTRPPRPNEENGHDYHFVDRQEFEHIRDQGAFLEWAEVHGKLYGTSLSAIQQELDLGLDIVLDIDVQGAALIRESGRIEASFIFIAPPSLGELERRLRGRATDSEETIKLRLANAAEEMAEAGKYQYLIINDEFDEAADVLRAIILAERAKDHRLPSGEPIELKVTG